MLENEIVVAYGKIFFISTHKSIPHLPEMSLLILKKDEHDNNFLWRAACIDLEIDACGNSRDEAWENLKEALIMYIRMEVNSMDGSIVNAAKTITESAFMQSEQKDTYFNRYRQAKLEYTMKAIDNGKLDPVEREKQRFEMLKKVNESIISFVEELEAA